MGTLPVDFALCLLGLCFFLYVFMYIMVQSNIEIEHVHVPFKVCRNSSDIESTAIEECSVEIDTKCESENNSTWCACLETMYPTAMSISANESFQNIAFRHKAINPYSFRLIYNSSDTCSSSSEIYLLSVVKSRARNIENRIAIRQTWGGEANSALNRIVFLLGHPHESKSQRNIQHEQSVFRDIIQGDFRESYYNNTLKTMMGIHWIATFCSNARFVFFVDDDIMVNFQNLLAFFKNVSSSAEVSLFSGNVVTLAEPFRDKREKWYISEYAFPYHCYPPYISGAATLTSGFVVKMLNTVIPHVKRLEFDDVFLGIVIQKLGIRPQKNDLVSMTRTNSKNMKDIIACHGFINPSEYVNTYESIIT